jgi:Zn-dependent protease
MSGFRLGKLFGIDIHIDWSWFLIFVLVSWSLSITFGQFRPLWPMEMRWGMALLAAFIFFASVLAHELAHSLAAQARGVPVRSITLFLFGGVANIQREPATPAEELFITVVGPLTSLFLGAVFLVLGAGSLRSAGGLTIPVTGQASASRVVLAWLGSINVMVGLFNLIPAFPLDGGRIFRALTWALVKDLRKSTRIASWLGQAIAWFMILAGVAMIFDVSVPFFGGGTFNGMWMILIGWFLNNAAISGYRQVLFQDVLGDIPVRKVMQTELANRPGVGPDGQTFLVTTGEEVVGLVGMNEVKKSSGNPWKSVKDIMTPVRDLDYVTPDQDAAEAFDRLQKLDRRQIAVMLNNQIVGLLRHKDLIRWVQFQTELGG